MGGITRLNREEYTVKWREWIPTPDAISYMLTLEDTSGNRIYADVPFEMYMIIIPGDTVECTYTGDGTARFELKRRD